jgi:hypothetical protein
MFKFSITQGLLIPVVLVMICSGCESKVEKQRQEQSREFDEWLERTNRSNYMLLVATSTYDGLKSPRDKDPKVAAKHRLFLLSVRESAHNYAKQLQDRDPYYVTALTDKIDLQKKDLEYVLDKGYEAAKLGVGDDALAKSFKEELLAAAKVNEEKYQLEADKKDARKKARENYK